MVAGDGGSRSPTVPRRRRVGPLAPAPQPRAHGPKKALAGVRRLAGTPAPPPDSGRSQAVPGRPGRSSGASFPPIRQSTQHRTIGLCRSTTFSTNCKPSPASRTAGYRAIPRCTWRSTTPPTSDHPPPSSRWREGSTSPCWRATCKRTTRAAPWSWAGRCGGRGTARPPSARYRICWTPSWPTSPSIWTRPCRNRCATWGPEADGRRVPRRGWRGSGVPVYGRFHPNRLK